MKSTSKGSCLCGSIQFEIFGNFESFFLCHCKYCQKDTGSAHAANLFSTSAQLLWHSGKEKVTHFQLINSRHSKSFCSICGSAMPYTHNELLVVPAGSLDDSVSIRPNSHLFIASKANWDIQLEAIPKLNGLPE